MGFSLKPPGIRKKKKKKKTHEINHPLNCIETLFMYTSNHDVDHLFLLNLALGPIWIWLHLVLLCSLFP